jgi:hypothetical protein
MIRHARLALFAAVIAALAGTYTMARADSYTVTSSPRPTTFFLEGSGAGSYTTPSTSFVAVDASNLEKTVTIPVGYKLLIYANMTVTNTSSGGYTAVALFDGSTQLVAQVTTITSSGQPGLPGSLDYVVAGDGNPHTIILEFRAGGTSGTAYVSNQSGTGSTPNQIANIMMVLMPSN